jgi:hypothetical protein
MRGTAVSSGKGSGSGPAPVYRTGTPVRNIQFPGRRAGKEKAVAEEAGTIPAAGAELPAGNGRFPV